MRVKTHLLRGDRPLVGAPELLDDTRVTAEILLQTNENDREAIAEVRNFGVPLQGR